MDKKPWYQSMTLWGAALVTISAVILPIFGKQEVATAIQEQQTSITSILVKIGEIIGIALTVFGRVKAHTNLSK